MFATDLNPAAIQVARAGRYPEGIAADVGAQRLARFFVEEEDALPRQEGAARSRRLRGPGRAARPALHARGSGVLPEPSDLPRAERAAAPAPVLPLQPESRRTPSARFIRERRPAPRSSSRRSTGTARSSGATTPPRRSRPSLAALATRTATPRAGRSAGPDGAKTDLAEPAAQGLAERFGPPAVLVDQRGPDPADPWARRRLSRAAGGARQPERRRHGAGRSPCTARLGASRGRETDGQGRRAKRPRRRRRRPARAAA